MICENCHQRPASVHVTRNVNGERHALELCANCARQLGLAPGAGVPFSLETMLETLFGARPNRQGTFASRLGGSAQAALQQAGQLAVSWGYDQIGVEFLLLGVAATAPWAPALLRSHGLSAEGLEHEISEAMGKREPLEIDQVSLTSRVKRVLELALHEALEQGAPLVGAEHVLVGLAAEGESLAAQLLAGRGLDADGLRRAYQALGARAEARGELGGTGGPEGGPAPSGAEGGFGRPDLGGNRPRPQAGGGGPQLPPNLAKYSRDLSTLAENGKLDPVVGREAEIERVIRILSRKTKNNPVLIGEPGVGKSAIAEGLAQRIHEGAVPDLLHGKRVLALDLGGMLAGAKFRGEFEERLKGLMDELRALAGKIVLFIDELHTVVGAGASEGAMDAANMLKPALARGELQVLGATTLDEYRKHIEKDAALERRFQPILVSEPTLEEALAILNGLRDSYEAHHRVKIADEALKAAVDLSDRYVSDRFLPDKAIDLLDEACAMERLGSRTHGQDLTALEEAVAKLKREKEAAVSAERYEQASTLKTQLDAKSAELEAARKSWTAQASTTEPVVGAEAIAKIVSEWTGIPASKLVKEEMARLLEMESDLHRRVVGQDEAVKAVAEAVRRARSGLKDPHRPIGSFLFAGPTGVGKTELARALAEHLFNDEAAMLRFDMSEYMEKHTVSRLIGAPPGYVGYDEAGQLTEAVRRKPYSVVLFDEVEKAHPDVFNLLLQVLDDGRLTDGQGRTVDFKNTIVIMTSNAGAQHLTRGGGAIGFSSGEQAEAQRTWEKQKETVTEALKQSFRPEFLNRVDEIIVFKPLDKPQIAMIVDKLLEATRRKLHGQAITLELTEAAKAALADAGFDPQYGARPLKRAIQRQLENPLSSLLLKGEFEEGANVRVDYAEGRFTFFQTERSDKAAGASA